MATQVQFRRGTTTQNNAFTGAIGEITYDTEAKTLRLHDGSTSGGGATVVTFAGTQTLTNKTLSTNSVWQGTAVGLAYGGTNASLTAVAGGVLYSGASALAISAAGTSGQVLTSAGSSAPTWTSQSSLTVGTATVATRATNIDGGSAGNLVYQVDTNQTSFIPSGAAGTFLRSTGASTAPDWAAGQVTYGSTTVAFGATSTSLAGLTSIDATSGATSFFATPTSPGLFAAATSLTLGFTGTASSTTNISTGAVGSGNTKTINIGTGGAAGSTTNINLGDADGGTVTVNKDLVVSGNLTINGTTTTVNSTTLDVDDINITIASGAANAAAANGAGLTVDGANATILYTSSGDKWSFNKPLDVTGDVTLSGAIELGHASDTTLSRSAAGVVTIEGVEIVTLSRTQTLTNKTLTSPTLTTPSLGVATATSINKVAITAPATGSTLTIADGKTLTASNTLTFTGTDSSSVAFGAGGTVAYVANKLSVFAATTSAELAGVISDETGSGALVFANTPTLVTPNIGAATGTSLTTTGGGVLARQASTQDGIEIRGRAGGTGNWEVILTPTTLSADRTFTFPDVSGTVVTTGDTGTVTSTMIVDGTIVNADINASAAIAVSKLAASTISGVTLGNNLNALTIGTGLSGTSYNGSSAVTIALPQAVGTTSSVQFGSFGVGTAASGTTGEIRATGDVTSNFSDERLKKEITEITNALDKVMQLKGVTFRANELAETYGYSSTKEQVGVLAQDVEKVLPQVVVPAPFDRIQIQEGVEISRSGKNYKTVHYEKIVPLLIQAIKEQQVMIEELKKKVGI